MNRFKVGDKVQMKDWESVIDFYSLPKIDNPEFIVAGIIDGELLIKPNCSTETNCYFIDKADAFELVAPTDPKREFLQRLQSLLREFDAEIQYFDGFAIRIGNCYESWRFDTITADNIMDFDKE